MTEGIYEEIINKLTRTRLNELDKNHFFIKSEPIDKEEAALILSQYLSLILKKALVLFTKENAFEKQLELANKLIRILRDELGSQDFEDDIIEVEGRLLKAVFSKIDSNITDFDTYTKEITPLTRLIHSELFTGGNTRLPLDIELKKEILSSNRIDFLVSFIKWSGIILLEPALKEFTERGGRLRVITTTYIGATDYKAIQLLSNLKNTEIKISYNTGNERVHAKAYLFFRNSGFHTGYIGSSNFSKSALTKGLEWNIKITSKEISHIIDKFQKTFETYWQSNDFELYDRNCHTEKLREALKQGKTNTGFSPTSFFDIKPFPFQNEILEKLEVERTVHNCFKNLVVAATGTGKTVISAFDYKRFRSKNNSARLLFVAHRKEILQQAQSAFQGILKDNNFGELWVDGSEPTKYDYLFASVKTLTNKLESLNLSENYFDFIVFDEVHHIKAKSYRPILEKFNPKILLGLTATPERMDGGDILEDFGDRIAAEIRLPEALNKKLLCPFQYFGISDSIDLSNITWSKGRYVPSELSKIYTTNDQRVGNIIFNLDKYLNDMHQVRALGFCVTQEHAQYMAEKFNISGLKSDYLTSNASKDQRRDIRHHLKNRKINYLFVVDIFNEGVDIPEIDTVLFLRPTESLTIFLQQFGRGLRLADDKECLMVLDFVGNARAEYDFEGKFRALIGKSNTSLEKEIENDFPHLPLGCSIVLEKKAKEIILSNIKSAINPNRNQIIQKIKNFENQVTLPLSLKNFSEVYHIPLQVIYKDRLWSRLCFEAGKIDQINDTYEQAIHKAIKNKWLSTNSFSYFNFILKLAQKGFDVNLDVLSENEKTMCLMLYFDVWKDQKEFNSLEEGIKALGINKMIVKEIIEILELLIEKIDFIELDIQLPYEQPLKLHARYTRDQILVAFKKSLFGNISKNREGVAENKDLNTELLFIDLIKSEKHFSPTTMYDDYAINETLFHWQSQNATRPDKGKGLTYIHHEDQGKKILLFVREQANNEFGNTIGYVFIGEGNLLDYYGSKPMSIKWQLQEPIPPFLWNASAKMAIG